MIAALVVAAQIGGRLLPVVGPRPLVPVGMLLAAGGMIWFTLLTLDSSYAGDILTGLVVSGLGLGLIVAPSIQTAISGVSGQDAGVASAAVNTVQQIGGSIGTALFSTLAASANDV